MASSSGNIKRVTLLSGARTAAATVTSDWLDCDEFTELMAWFDVTAFAARADETIDVTIERQADNTAGYTTIATFTQKASTGASSEEETATSLIGGKIRARAVLAGTWSSKSITFTVKVMLKRA